jgi:hypothetical protein
MRLDHEVGEVGTPRQVDRQRPEAALRPALLLQQVRHRGHAGRAALKRLAYGEAQRLCAVVVE